MEIVKYYLLGRIMEDYSGDTELRIFFSKQEGETLLFNLIGLKENEVGVMRVPLQTLRKAESQLDEKRQQEPFSEILKGPYVSINKLYYDEG